MSQCGPAAELAEAHAALAATRFEAVLELATPIFRAARDAGQWAMASEAALLMGRAHANLSQPEPGLRWMQEAAQAARLAGSAEPEALAWLQLAAEHARYERVAAALQALEEAASLVPQVHRADRLYPLLSSAAATYYGLGLLAVAFDFSQRALDVAGRLPDLPQRLSARTNVLLVGTSAHEQLLSVDPDAAAALARDLVAQLGPLRSEADQVGMPRATARAMMVAGRVHMAFGEWELARDRFQALLAMSVDLPRVLWCSAWVALARVLSRLGDAEGARAAARQAEGLVDPPRPGEPRTHELRRRAEIAELLGRPEEALALFRQLHERAQYVLASAFEARLAEFHARIDQQGLYIENTALREQNAGLSVGLQNLGRLAITDPLTGLLNRRGLDAVVAALRQGSTAYTLALVDVDHFKRINDGYSHAVGDQVLVRLATCMAQALREGDHLVRFGGEEFAVLLPGVGLQDAVAGLERLRTAVQAHDWSTVMPGMSVTVSAGLTAAEPVERFEDALLRVDALLYEAKRQGRNRVAFEAAPGQEDQRPASGAQRP